MTVRQGEIYWIKLKENSADEIVHPHLIIQDDILNDSRISTTVVCAISTNMKKAYQVGNVALGENEGNLEKRSVVIVSQVSTVNLGSVGQYIGKLSQERVEEVLRGMKQQQNLRSM
jgi:mRNA interferase MazF